MDRIFNELGGLQGGFEPPPIYLHDSISIRVGMREPHDHHVQNRRHEPSRKRHRVVPLHPRHARRRATALRCRKVPAGSAGEQFSETSTKARIVRRAHERLKILSHECARERTPPGAWLLVPATIDALAKRYIVQPRCQTAHDRLVCQTMCARMRALDRPGRRFDVENQHHAV